MEDGDVVEFRFNVRSLLNEAVAGSREGVARPLAYGESNRSICVTKCAMLLEYQGILALMARIPVVVCVGPSPTRLPI